MSDSRAPQFTHGELSGTWWKPNQSQDTETRTLHVTDGRPGFKESPQDAFNGTDGAALLHGALDKIGQATLWGKDQRGFRERTFDTLILGGHVSGRDDARWKSLEIWIEDVSTEQSLSRWGLLETPILHSTDADNDDSYEPATVVNPYPVDSNEAFTATIVIRRPARLVEREIPGFRQAKMMRPNASGETSLLVTFEPAIAAKTLETFAGDLQGLISFYFSAPAIIDRQQWTEANSDDPVEVVQKLSVRQGNKGVTLGRLLLHAADLELKVSAPLWWQQLEQRFPVPQVACTYFHRPMLLEHVLSSTVAAMERLHEIVGTSKTRFDPNLVPNDSKLRTAFPGDERKELRQILRETLKRENRPTLQTKLIELIDNVPIPFMSMLKIEREGWLKSTKDARNLIAHTASHASSRDAATADELFLLSMETRAALTMMILNGLEASESALNKAAESLNVDLEMMRNSALV